MEKIAFEDVFKKMKISANVKSILKNTYISDMSFKVNTGTMTLSILSDDFFDEACLDDLKSDIKENIEAINNVDISVIYPMENISDEEKIGAYLPRIIEQIAENDIVSANLLSEAKWEIDDTNIIFWIDHNGSYLLKYEGIDTLIKDTIRLRLNMNYGVKFKNQALSDEKPDFSEFDVIINNFEENKKTVAESKSVEKDIKRQPIIKGKKTVKNNNSRKISLDAIEDKSIPISEVYSYEGLVTVEGEVFIEEEIKEIKDNRYIVKSAIKDNKTAVIIKMFCDADDYKQLYKSYLKKGAYTKIQGRIAADEYENYEKAITITALNKSKAPEGKIDDAYEKRIELHLHTTMSMMDGITPASTYIKRAVKWGHKAIAITDHGVVQAFPEAMKAAKGTGIKVLYGCEGYLVNDMGAIVKNSKAQSLDDTYVVFDIETTGLKKEVDKIIEIGAVKVKNGEIIDRYSTFVNPHMEISQKITKLTGIDQSMVKDYDDENVVVPDFLEFIGDSILVAHNAAFDVSFIRQWAVNNNIVIDNTVVDTVELGRALLPSLHNFKLDTICDALDVSLKNHHRAVHDAEATALCFIKFIDMLKKESINNLDDVNSFGAKNIDKAKITKRYHIIIFAKNQQGVTDLYKLVSAAHIDYFNVRSGRPHFPKSEILKYRDNFILGSACEAGDLYDAVYNNLPEDDIKEIVDFYDYLEVQPLGNNGYMINNTKKNGKTVKGIEDLIDINKRIIELGDKYNKPVVATGDVHFIDPEDADYRRIVQIGEGFKLEDVENQAPLYFRTTQEMLDEFYYLDDKKAYEIVVTNTNLVADMIDDGIYAVPNEKCPPKIEGADEELREITTTKAKSIYGDPLPKIVESRLNRELDSIIGNGYAVLYIIAQKLVWDSNDHGYIVGSRGSVGSSFAATMAGITEVNPLDPHYVCPNCKYSDFESEEVQKVAGNSGFDLPDKKCPVCGAELNKDGQAIPFETFLGFNGDKEPDIDLNFSGEDQTRAHKYCEELFGEGHVFKAGTIATLQDKTVFGYVKKYCEAKGITMRNADMQRLVAGCVGVKRSTGQHPGGLVVVPDYTDIHRFCPVQHPANKASSGVKTTHFDYHSIDSCLLKLDMLGHDVPTILRMFYDITGFDPLNVPMNDSATMSLFTSPKALGVTEEQIHCKTGSLGLPEFGTPFVIGMLLDTQPKTFSGLVKISGLSHGTDVWNGNAQLLIENGTCTLNEVIPTRDDIMVYLILHHVENKTAFDIMEHVRKGKGLTAEEEAIMREHDVPDWYIDSCKKIKYMFPKGHAVAYCTNTFRIGYFKINYPHAFYAAFFSMKYEDFDYEHMCNGLDKAEEYYDYIQSLGKEASDKDAKTADIMKLVIEMYVRGLDFVPIDIYKSEATKFKVLDTEDGKKVLLPPLCTIQGFGITVAEELIKAREDGEFVTLEDMQLRTGFGKKTIQMLKDAHVVDHIRDTAQLTLF